MERSTHSGYHLKYKIALLLVIVQLASSLAFLASYLYFRSEGEWYGLDTLVFVYAGITLGTGVLATLVNFEKENRLFAVSYFTLYASMAIQSVILGILFYGSVLLTQYTLDKNGCTTGEPYGLDGSWCADLLKEKWAEQQPFLLILYLGLTSLVATILFFALKVQYRII